MCNVLFLRPLPPLPKRLGERGEGPYPALGDKVCSSPSYLPPPHGPNFHSASLILATPPYCYICTGRRRRRRRRKREKTYERVGGFSLSLFLSLSLSCCCCRSKEGERDSCLLFLADIFFPAISLSTSLSLNLFFFLLKCYLTEAGKEVDVKTLQIYHVFT